MGQQYPGLTRERRAWVRYAHKLPISCRPLGKNASHWPATIKDLSHTGAALVLPHEVRRGTVLVVALERLSGRFARPLLLRVLNVRPADNGWLAGCTFVQPLTDHDVQTLLLAKQPGG